MQVHSGIPMWIDSFTVAGAAPDCEGLTFITGFPFNPVYRCREGTRAVRELWGIARGETSAI